MGLAERNEANPARMIPEWAMIMTRIIEVFVGGFVGTLEFGWIFEVEVWRAEPGLGRAEPERES
jgi:hypothetical protein